MTVRYGLRRYCRGWGVQNHRKVYRRRPRHWLTSLTSSDSDYILVRPQSLFSLGLMLITMLRNRFPSVGNILFTYNLFTCYVGSVELAVLRFQTC